MQKTSNNRNAIVIIGILFFVFGFVTWLNGTLIPFLKLACQLENDIQAFFVTSAFYMAYFSLFSVLRPVEHACIVLHHNLNILPECLEARKSRSLTHIKNSNTNLIIQSLMAQPL